MITQEDINTLRKAAECAERAHDWPLLENIMEIVFKIERNTINHAPVQEEYCTKCGGAGFFATGVHHFGMTEEIACPCTLPAQSQEGK